MIYRFWIMMFSLGLVLAAIVVGCWQLRKGRLDGRAFVRQSLFVLGASLIGVGSLWQEHFELLLSLGSILMFSAGSMVRRRETSSPETPSREGA